MRPGVLLYAAVVLCCSATDVQAQRQEQPRLLGVERAFQKTAVTDPWSLAPHADQEPRRQTRRGARIGAVVGVIGGTALGSLTALWCVAFGDPCYWTIPAGAVAGAASGAAAGAIIGAAIPAEAPSAAAERATPRRIGSVALSAGAASANVPAAELTGHEQASGVAVRVNLAAELRPWLALGPDAGMAFFGGDERIRHIALEARLTLPSHPVSPYIAGNLGAYQATRPSLEFLGGSVGAGARWTFAGRRRFIDAGIRRTSNVQYIDPVRMTGVYIGGGTWW
jgi:hypothetical protein